MTSSGIPAVGSTPIVLGPNQPERFYLGGDAIARLRGTPAGRTNVPEDWIASATESFGEGPIGLTVLDGGLTLRDAVAGSPELFLGPEHRAAFGDDPALLVKLLDAGERLPVHCHPDRAFAREHLASAHGKTEAWVVISCPADAAVYLGFREEVPEEVLSQWVSRQERGRLLDSLCRIAIAPGDTVVVPAGTPHAIGAGVFVIELQEPTDFSVMLEREGFALGGAGDLGLGDAVLGCVDRSAWSPSRLASVKGHDSPGPAQAADILAPVAAPFFRAERVPAGCERDAGYAVLIALSGSGELVTEHGGSVPMVTGTTVLVPYAAGRSTLGGTLQAIRCRPPDPSTVRQ